jgi:DHA2 family multidrug resistance protein
VLAWTGLPQLVIIPLVPLFMTKVDARLLVFSGLCIFAASCFMDMYLSPDFAGDQLWLPNIVRALGQAVVLSPLASIAMTGIGRQEFAAASGLFNMLRNLGGAFGTALLATIVTRREQFHSDVIGSSVTVFRDVVRQRIDDLTAYFMSHGVSDPAAAQQKAFVALGDIIRKQAMIMGYGDTFAVLGGLLLLAAALILFTRKAQASGPGGH